MSFSPRELVGTQQGTEPDSKVRSSAPSMDFTIALVSDVLCCTRTRVPTVRSRSASQQTVPVSSRTGAGGASVAARMSPRETSMSVSSRITTD